MESRSPSLKRDARRRRWAAKRAESRSARGVDWEARVADLLRARGHAVEPQRPSAPFDLLVDGARVDVKMAVFTEYQLPSRPGYWLQGYQFAHLKRGRDCDAFVLVCATSETEARGYFVVPATDARVTRVTIMASAFDGRGKWAPYLDAWHHLRRAA
jgi:hypothetical protein